MRDDKLFNTAVDLCVHAVLTAALAVYFYYKTGGLIWPVLSVAGGIFIDLDHLIDYFLYFGPRFNIVSFLKHEYQQSGKCYVFFHSWEIMVILWVMSGFVRWFLPLAAGVLCHMFIDSIISHRTNLLSLSLVYRWVHGFSIKKPEKN